MKTFRIDKIILIALILSFTFSSALWAHGIEGINDSDITSSIETLMKDWKMSPDQVKVMTKDGIVMLSGTVDNLFAKERAVEVAKATRGCLAVIDLIEVNIPNRGDEQIRKDIIEAWAANPIVETNNIKIEVSDGIVKMSGVVNSFPEQYMAERIAKGIKGVKNVENNTKNEHISHSDDDIKAAIEARLKDNVYIDAENIKVQVKNGDVKLTGSVSFPFERLRAKWNARVAGVKSVDVSDLRIVKTEEGMKRFAGFVNARSDADIRDTMEHAFIYDPRIGSSQISVEVKDHFVTLKGNVDNLKVKAAAEEDALNTFGVIMVNSYLTVPVTEEGTNVKDSEILDAVSKAIMKDPNLENFHFRISVLNGKVRLNGTVYSYSDKYHAEDVVSSIKGVMDVQNDLTVGGE